MHYLAPGDTVQSWPRVLQPSVHMHHAGMLGEAGGIRRRGATGSETPWKAPALRNWERKVCLGESQGTGHFAQLLSPACPVQVQTVGRALPTLRVNHMNALPTPCAFGFGLFVCLL